VTDASAYCREIESYLCRRNGGHLIRIVGPAFEIVRGWAEQGVPLKVAYRGIDRTCDRDAAKPGRRRPVRIEFCEADVLAAFDDWRRAIGAGADRVSEAPPARKESLASHIERTVTRLLAVPLNGHAPALAVAVKSSVDTLDTLVERARQVRGDERERIIAHLAELDDALLTAARADVDPANARALQAEAAAEIGTFAARMSDDARARAQALAYDRLLRDALKLPVVRFE
jgi:hypothetical protein